MNEVYYIFINSGDRMYALGNGGTYEEEIAKAMSFDDKLDAIIYVEKHGYERISTIRKVSCS